jgi:hypothetical protein
MKTLSAALLFLIASNSWAFGEIFALKASGTQYCSGYKPLRLTPSNSSPLFIRFDNATTLSVFVDYVKPTPDFIANLDAAYISFNALSFSAVYVEDDTNLMTTIGTIKLDKLGSPRTLNGTFTRKGVSDWCYAVGKLTGKRIN